jgi:hypothetical protein
MPGKIEDQFCPASSFPRSFTWRIAGVCCGPPLAKYLQSRNEVLEIKEHSLQASVLHATPGAAF